MIRFASTMLAVGLLTFAPYQFALAQTGSVGHEFQVNTYVTGRALYPSVARSEVGAYMVVWQERFSVDDDSTDGDGTAIRGRLLDAAGAGVGADFLVNTFSTGNVVAPQIRTDPVSDGFVVLFDNRTTDELRGRRYDSSGAAVGTEFIVNGPDDDLKMTDFAIGPSGDLLVVFNNDTGVPQQSIDVAARRFDSSGTALDALFQVNTYTTFVQTRPAVDVDGSGEFVVAWRDCRAGCLLSDEAEIHARRVSSSGSPLGAVFTVNGPSIPGVDARTFPDVARSPSGEFFVAWTRTHHLLLTDTEVRVRRFDPTGVALGAEITACTNGCSLNNDAQIAADADGDFVVAWYGAPVLTEESTGSSLRPAVARFDGSGTPLGGETLMGRFAVERETGVAIAVAADDAFVTVWSGEIVPLGASCSLTGSRPQVRARRYGATTADPPCPAVPSVGCLAPSGGKAAFSVKDKAGGEKDKIAWKWSGEEHGSCVLGDPRSGSGEPSYRLCVYDDSGLAQPLASAEVGPGGTCGKKPCWKSRLDVTVDTENRNLEFDGSSHTYKDKAAASDGFTDLKLQPRKGKVQAKAAGPSLDTPAPPFILPVTVQLLADSGEADFCYESVFTTAKSNDAGKFKAKQE